MAFHLSPAVDRRGDAGRPRRGGAGPLPGEEDGRRKQKGAVKGGGVERSKWGARSRRMGCCWERGRDEIEAELLRRWDCSGGRLRAATKGFVVCVISII